MNDNTKYLAHYCPKINKFKLLAIVPEDVELTEEDFLQGLIFLSRDDLKIINKDNIIVPKNVTIR